MGQPSAVSPRTLSWCPPGLSAALDAAVALGRDAKNAVVVAHHGPDGDAIGSTLGMATALEQLGVAVVRFSNDPVPRALRFLPGADLVVDRLPDAFVPDLTVVLDCSGRARVGVRFPAHGWATKTLCIDHHATVDRTFADVLVHDVDAAATAELVYRFLVAAGGTLTPDLATCLFTALHTDTGSFRYGCTTAHTMEVASCLLETGIDVWGVASSLYETQELSRVRLLAQALSGLRLSQCGRLALLPITLQMFAEAGASIEDADGLINQARSIRGVEVAAQVTEASPFEWRVSFRSRGNVDVSGIAAQFGGGGHKNAAGCTLNGPLETVAADVLAAIDAASAPA